MLDHVFTDAISALRDAFEAAFLERQAFEEHFQVDVLLGDLTWETSYGLPGEGQPPRVVAHVTFDWPTWSQTVVPPLVRRRGARRAAGDRDGDRAARSSASPSSPTRAPCLAVAARHQPARSATSASSAPGSTVEIGHPDPNDPADADGRSSTPSRSPTRAVRAAEETLADGVELDPRRALRGARRLDRVDARAARRPAARVPARRRRRRLSRRLTVACTPVTRPSRCCSTSRDADRRRHAQPARGAQRAVERGAARCCRELMRAGRRRRRRRRDHPHRRRPGVLRRARPEGARLDGRATRAPAAVRRSAGTQRRPRPVPDADQAADRRDQRRRHHRRVRAGAQLRLPRRQSSAPSSATPTRGSA